MKKALIIALVAMCLTTVALAETSWVQGHAMNAAGTRYLNGWTIKCNNGTYGSNAAVAPYGSFGLFTTTYPPAGYYQLTADSSGQLRLNTSQFYYNGDTPLDLGNVTFHALD